MIANVKVKDYDASAGVERQGPFVWKGGCRRACESENWHQTNGLRGAGREHSSLDTHI